MVAFLDFESGVFALNISFSCVFGNGQQTRSFCYIDDQVDGILRLLVSSITGPVNIGNPQEMTVKKMAQLIIQLCRSRSQIKYRILPIDDPKVRQPNIHLARKKLKWTPRISPELGVKRTIDWFRLSLNK